LKTIFLPLLCIFFIGCSHKISPNKEVIHDLINIDQNVSVYLNNISPHYIGESSSYEDSYFKPWRIQKIDLSLKDAMWAYRAFSSKNSYGENLQPLEASFFEEIQKRSNFKAFATLNKDAITLRMTNIRAFPTNKPLLMDPNKAGEGFPFDYLQNSIIAANKPLLVSHYSRDKEWAFVEASFAYGWVKVSDIAFIPSKYAKRYMQAQKEFITKEGEAIYDQKGNFLFRSRVGMLLPEIDELADAYKVLTISNYKNNQAYYLESMISKKIAHQGILEFNSKNIEHILNEVSNVKYGWGGMYGQRDCSSLLRDFYAPFGIWLPRNSSKQSQIGKVIDLQNLSEQEKLQKIKEFGIPFETLLYKRGHILLYVGTYGGKVIVFHNTWGVKTKENGVEGRFIIGRPIFSTLELGKDLHYYDKTASLLMHLQSMNILTAK